MRKIWSLILILFIVFPSIFSFTSIASAKDTDDSEVKSCDNAFKDAEMNGKIEDFRDNDASILEQYALDLIELVMNALNINTLEQLLFGNPFCIWFNGWGDQNVVFGAFPEKIYTDIVHPGFLLFTSISVIFFCLAVMILGIKLSGRSLGFSRVNAGEEFYMFFITIATLIGYWIGVEILFKLNASIVSSLKDLIESQGVSLSSFSLVATADEFNFTDMLVLFGEWVLVLFLNVVYMMRLFLISLLMMVGGLVIVGLLFKSTRGAFPKWLLDFCGAIFMQSIHAIYFTMVILFVSIGNLSVFFKFALLILFLPMGSMLMNLMGFSAANMAVTSTSKGVAALNTANRFGKMSKGFAAKKLPLGKLSGGTTKISALANGTNGKGWGLMKSAAQLGGSFAGATAGLVIGAHGASLGASVGSNIAGKALQAPRNVIAGVKGVLDTRKKIGNNELNMDNISDKRRAYGSYGESVGVMFGKGEAGRALGERFSGVSNERLMSSTELGGLGGTSLSDIATKYPDAKVMFEQTNEGSGFYMQNGEDKQLISPIGLADSTLPDGLTRTMEYSPNTQQSMPNGEHSMPNMNSNLYSLTGAPALRDDLSGATVADNNFASTDYFKPENHCNIGQMPNSIEQLSNPTPFENKKGGEA